MNMNEKFVGALEKDGFAVRLSLALSSLFFVVYLWSIENLLFRLTSFGVSINSNWQELLFRERASFLWEPIGVVSLGFVDWFVSFPNLVLGGILAFLFFLNIFLAVFTYRLPARCRVNRSGLLGVLPASLTGFACCAPTFLIAIAPLTGAGATAFFADFAPWLVPLSLVLMIGGFLLMLYQFPENALD